MGWTSFASIIASAFLSSAPDSKPIAIDIAMVDTGSYRNLNGPVFMKKSANHLTRFWGFEGQIHGTLMAKAMLDQAKREKLKNVQAIQVPYLRDENYLEALFIALARSPKVLSLSVTGNNPSEKEFELLEIACRKNIVVVVASGNNGNEWHSYPASYKLPCLISVSSQLNGHVPPMANIGDAYVPLGSEYERGTSFSTARASIIALKYLRLNPGATPVEVKTWMTGAFPHPAIPLSASKSR